MSYINIPRDRNDPNYRYKMPRLISKIEGRGNGIRTNIANMGEIARSLKRPPMYPTKFFGCELGTMVKFEENEEKAIVNGAHKENDLVNILDKFIEMYVLCPHCLLPETDIIVKKGFLICKCNACGNIGELNNSHKIATYMIKNPPQISTVGSKKKKTKEKKVEKNGKGKGEKGGLTEKGDKNEETRNGILPSGGDYDSSDALDTDKSNPVNSENVKKDKKSKKKDKKKNKTEDNFVLEKESLHFDSVEIKEVIDRLRTLFVTFPNISENDFCEELRVLQVSQSFDSKCRIFICLSALFDNQITKELLQKYIKYIKKVNDTSVTVMDIFLALEYYVNKVAVNALIIYPYILQVLYNNDILESKDIIKWYDVSSSATALFEKSNNSESLDERNKYYLECYNKCKCMAKHFVSWLKENESDEDESEEEDNQVSNHVNSNLTSYKVKSLRNNDDKSRETPNGGSTNNVVANDNDKAFEDSKSEKCEEEIFLDAKDGINYTGDEEEIDIDAI
ncbi:eukaryotic translation initiation factor 5, putative [Plasmodium knowlesi strain H]|uniref:Eukaryotic translation initiation factor 5, putative n=3 Tax=Plasmodium knowlesi TaxID=5850 RepID=A0A5K1VTA1_PLAKH|nr:eukaryotic translation initiation factor 5, putative [Plasmodium knowlesi strain H]OTN66872.1 putative Eukaryotic translation initiation factor 5 [Plasmodium knowlesi]CAA9990106.1 eukaryotic translation initiation factor 5, putative [Plasmodium knowlesi strain H]SBO25782.1 eukaryotic translation initiation factor 5, putative [Plasmodium knowlesi strain H]SBO28578.1 eukaryotic translation initiation factor 5, putative [Plasmodium knowlesi strain H]VVS79580.1 eukaryotic translation initiation|eukprot:XP_002260573.1 eukaryotic translation initiation factor,putative [Plasmodium knowlesi strain H]